MRKSSCPVNSSVCSFLFFLLLCTLEYYLVIISVFFYVKRLGRTHKCASKPTFRSESQGWVSPRSMRKSRPVNSSVCSFLFFLLLCTLEYYLVIISVFFYVKRLGRTHKCASKPTFRSESRGWVSPRSMRKSRSATLTSFSL